MTRNGDAPLRFWLFATLFIFSGISGLVYQVVWARKLQISFGVTAFAVSAVLAAYFLGLALGSIIGGRYSDHVRSPLLVYGIVEIVVGITAILITPYIDRLDIFVIPLQAFVGENFWFLQGSRFFITLAVLLVPTTLLGMTMPLMSRGLISSLSNIGSRLAILYGLNTFGAAAGVLLAGFYVIETYGLRVTAVSAATLSILVGVLAIFVQGTFVDIAQTAKRQQNRAIVRARSGSGVSSLVLVVMAISGAVGLSLEVVWTRVLIQNLGTTAYVFSAVLFLFLLGIGLGSYIVNHSIDHWKNLTAKLAFCEAALGFVTIIGSSLLKYMPAIIEPAFHLMGISPSEHYVLSWFVWSAGLLLPATILLGATFPLAARVLADNEHVIGGRVGQLYAANTLGGVFGVTITGFLLIPHAGIDATVITLAIVSATLAIMLGLAARESRASVVRYSTVPLLLLVAALVWFPPDLVQSRMTANVRGTVLQYKEDYYGTILLTEESNLRDTFKRLSVNGISYSGTGKEAMRYMRLQGHLPMAVHQGKPGDILVICFGVGLTAGSISTYPDTKLTIVELSEAILSLSDWFLDANEDVIHSGSTKIVVDDGRNYMLRNENKRFDVITLEPPPPSHAGMANLYSQDFYRLVYDRLRDGGVSAQWIPLHTQSQQDTKMLLASFISVFPQSSLWWT